MRHVAVALVCACSFTPHGQQNETHPDGAPVPDAAPDTTPPPDTGGGTHAITAVQEVGPGFQDTGSFDVAITTTTGNLLVAATYASAVDPVTVTDSHGLTWTSLPAVSLSNDINCPDVQVQLWYAALTGPTTTTVNVAQNNSAALGMHVIEYAGVASASPIDVHDGRIAPSPSNAMSTAPLVTTSFDAVVALFADVAGTGRMTAGSGWTDRGHDSGFYTLVVDNTPGAAAGTYAPAGALPANKNDACWITAVVALRAQ